MVALRSTQRGLMYAENKPLVRLFRMCNTFLNEFRVTMSVKGVLSRLLYCYCTVYSPRRVDPDRRLAHLSRMRWARGPMICLVMVILKICMASGVSVLCLCSKIRVLTVYRDIRRGQ